MLRQVFLMEQLEGDPGFLPLGMEVRGIGPRSLRRRARPVEPRLQRLVVEAVDGRPLKAGGPRASERGGDHADAEPQAGGHRPMAQAQDPFLPQHLPNVSHEQSLGRHPVPPLGGPVDNWTLQRQLTPRHPPRPGKGACSRWPIALFTIPI